MNNQHLKTSSDRYIIALFWEFWVAESNGCVRIIVTGSSGIAVSANAQ